MNIYKTKEFYKGFCADDTCQCTYCQNYIKQIKLAYPEVADYLQTIGVNIERPYEIFSLEPESGYLDYIAALYIVMGTKEDFRDKFINGVSISIEESHPAMTIIEEHFVISICPIKLKWLY